MIYEVTWWETWMNITVRSSRTGYVNWDNMEHGRRYSQPDSHSVPSDIIVPIYTGSGATTDPVPAIAWNNVIGIHPVRITWRVSVCRAGSDSSQLRKETWVLLCEMEAAWTSFSTSESWCEETDGKKATRVHLTFYEHETPGENDDYNAGGWITIKSVFVESSMSYSHDRIIFNRNSEDFNSITV